MPPKRKLAWTKPTPISGGWYWYRSADKTVVLHLFDPWDTGTLKAWDFQNGRMQLCAIADYDGEWYGPIQPPV